MGTFSRPNGGTHILVVKKFVYGNTSKIVPNWSTEPLSFFAKFRLIDQNLWACGLGDVGGRAGAIKVDGALMGPLVIISAQLMRWDEGDRCSPASARSIT